MAIGLGADVTILDRNIQTLRDLVVRFGPSVETLYSTGLAIEEQVLAADLVIGGVLVKGAEAPKLVSEDLVRRMKAGSVLVDVAIDQGGCFETSHATTHSDPTYIGHDVVHYCVANMPGAVARTSTYALNNVTLPFVLALADKGYRQALREGPHLLNGPNVHQGDITYEAVALDLGYDFVDPSKAITD
jgi:alanine dehydrogenase